MERTSRSSPTNISMVLSCLWDATSLPAPGTDMGRRRQENRAAIKAILYNLTLTDKSLLGIMMSLRSSNYFKIEEQIKR
jgi:hypothetical protein